MNEQTKKYLQDLDNALDSLSDEDLARLVKEANVEPDVAAYYAVLETSVLGCAYVGIPTFVGFSENGLAEAA